MLESVRGLDGYADPHLELTSLRPTVVNAYQRDYFATPDRQHRVTLGYDVRCYPLRSPSFGSKLVPRRHTAELKSPAHLKARATTIWGQLGVRLVRNSKYLNALPESATF